jgi:CheY-like chemotaxis protein
MDKHSSTFRSELGNDVLIVAVTGYGQSHDKEAAANAGFDAHLTEPVDSSGVAKLLTQRGPGHNC